MTGGILLYLLVGLLLLGPEVPVERLHEVRLVRLVEVPRPRAADVVDAHVDAPEALRGQDRPREPAARARSPGRAYNSHHDHRG